MFRWGEGEVGFFEGEDPFVFEEFELEAGEKRGGVIEGGNGVEVGFEEEVEVGSAFAWELGGKDALAEGACGLKMGELMAQDEVFVEDGAIGEAHEV